jgi:hypothetical protein
MISGPLLALMLGALLSAKARRWIEKSESDAKDG